MTNIHLLTLIHGMWGNPEHLAELARTIRELHSEPTSDGTKLHVLVAETNRDDSTYDGIDWGGERVAQEIYDEIDKLEVDGNHVTRFSITGYSLGGLVSRYVVGILHRKKFFDRITPVNFNTIATPHIGLPRFRSFMSGVFSTLGPKLLSRTGEQFYCIDKWSDTERPLLQVMADPDRIFYQALALFQTRRIYANAVNDVTVPFVTAAIETYDPFLDASSKGLDVEINTKYKHLISTFSQPPTPPIRAPKARMFSRQWWKRSRRPLLPPALQFKFPYNLLLYLLIPLLLPVGISLVVVRLSLATRGSRTRIRLLEKDKATDTLMSAIASLEHSVESTVVDIMETDSAPIQNDSDSKEQPVLTPLQISIAKNLNTLPIEKELAYFQDVRNSHAMIVARDVKRFPVHQEGEGILRHWADSFIM